MKLTVVGSGDAFGSGGRLQTCYHVEAAATRFLIDCGADRTVLGAFLLTRLGEGTASAPAGLSLAGVGGTQSFVRVQAALELHRDDSLVKRIYQGVHGFEVQNRQ